MKQFKILNYLLVAVLCLGFAACSDDDDPTFEDSQVVGAWTVTRAEGYENYKGDNTPFNDPYEDGEWVFYFGSDKKGYTEDEEEVDPFNWSLNGNKVTLSSTTDKQTFTILQLNSTTCVIEFKEAEKDYEFYTKISLKKYNLPK